MTEQLPPGAVPIDARDFFECIGELYFQVHKLRQVVQQQQQQQQQPSSNGIERTMEGVKGL